MKLKIVKTDKGYVAVSDEKLKEDNWSYGVSNKIIATDTSFKLEGIPQFELPAILDGVESTEEKGCYSIEDMRKAYNLGYSNGEQGFDEESFEERFINQPKKLVAIEILTRKTHPRADEYTKDGDIIDVPFTQDKSPEYPDGLVIIKQYYYEHV